MVRPFRCRKQKIQFYEALERCFRRLLAKDHSNKTYGVYIESDMMRRVEISVVKCRVIQASSWGWRLASFVYHKACGSVSRHSTLRQALIRMCIAFVATRCCSVSKCGSGLNRWTAAKHWNVSSLASWWCRAYGTSCFFRDTGELPTIQHTDQGITAVHSTSIESRLSVLNCYDGTGKIRNASTNRCWP